MAFFRTIGLLNFCFWGHPVFQLVEPKSTVFQKTFGVATSVRRIFERGEGDAARSLEREIKTFLIPHWRTCSSKKWRPKKRSSFRFGPIFRPKLGEDPPPKKKIGLHSDSVRLSAQIFCPSYKGRGACRNFAYYSVVIILYWRPNNNMDPPLIRPWVWPSSFLHNYGW